MLSVLLLALGTSFVLGMRHATDADHVVAVTAIAAPSVYAGARVARLQRGIRVTSGALSVGFGLYLAHRIGFVDGLFTGAPR